MLPEFLYPVGNSMQDISRDDFSLLNGTSASEKETNCTTLINTGTQLSLPPSILTPTAQSSSTTTSLTSTTTPSLAPINCLGTDISRANSALQSHFRPNIAIEQNNLFEASTSLIGDIKLEEQSSSDLFPTHASTWQQHPMNSHEHAHHRNQHQHHQQHNQYRFMSIDGVGCSKLLLQGSDDPLISRGANSVTDDDPPAEFNTLIAAASTKEQQQYQKRIAITPTQLSCNQTKSQSRPSNGCSTLTKQQLKIKANLMSQTQQQQKNQSQVQPTQTPPKIRTSKAKKKPAAVKLRFHHQALPAEYLSHYEATQSQAQTQKKEVYPVKLTSTTAKLPPPKSVHENVRSWLQKIAELQRNTQSREPQSVTHDTNNNQPETVCAMTEAELNSASPTIETKVKHTMAAAQAKRVVKYSDLPYMGEITLDHSKPRRGRKPKKADICHLIYKNYGTILPGTPKNKLDNSETLKESVDINVKQALEEDVALIISHDEPLNLCLRDQSVEDSFSISSNDDDNEDDEHELEESLTEFGTSNCVTPMPIATDIATDSILATNLKLAMKGVLLEEQTTSKTEPSSTESPIPICVNSNDQANPSSLMHPMSLYYQKLIESGTLITPSGLAALGLPIETIQRDNQLALKIPIPSGLFLTPKQEKTSPAPCISGNQLEYPEPMSTPSSIKSEISVHTNASSANQPVQPVPKRKRSAIFIPPIPAENANNPSNEVSICKFKFTGGARPSLQEKKMLSVDAGGNYRYYSGTGDKSMRGYEFFPRESLQNNGGALPTCGEKLALDIPPPSAGLSNELLQIPDSPTSNLLMLPNVATAAQESITQANSVSSLTPSPKPITVSSTSSSNGQSQKLTAERKKKTRRSTQREKLEKTFKEKGFLIQTQQLESAEGATYCKFRQLKKFTRYLFRNWKDYLPDELQQANEAAAAAAAAAVLSVQHPSMEHHSSVTGLNTAPSLENILASHGFSGAQTRLLRERHLATARMPVESSLE